MNIGDSAEASFTVQQSDTAQASSLMHDELFPAVFATARMVALMELAAARLMKPLLKNGELSVGVTVNVRHTAPTPVGSLARAVATYLGPEGKFYKFKLEAFDDAGLIGDGDHTRAIINNQRLLDGAARRLPKT